MSNKKKIQKVQLFHVCTETFKMFDPKENKFRRQCLST